MSENRMVLSEKYKLFLTYLDAEFETLEGTTASGKTTVGATKFLIKVGLSDKKLHIIAGQDIGVIEKNIIASDLGILDVFGNTVTFYRSGHGNIRLPHLVLHTPHGDKIVLLFGYKDESRWKKALGGQYGCSFIDEINTANMAFVRQVVMRCDYTMCTLNPDDPDKEIYKEFINRCRPLPEVADQTPTQLLEMLNEEPMENWIHWYFSFDDNEGLPEKKKEQIKRTHLPGSADYKHYIQGLRGKAEGVIFDNFDTKRHCITYKQSLDLIRNTRNREQKEYFIAFTAGLDTAYSPNTNDTIAMSFLGITNTRKLVLLDELVLNNKESKKTFAPSDIVSIYEDFLDKNKDIYGFALNSFIDCADQATMSEFKKHKGLTGSVYNFNNAHKSLKVIDRIQLQKGWFATDDMLVVDTCKSYIKELQTYSWSDNKNKTEPEDANDHMINSVQYAWIPFKDKIGQLIKK